MKKNLLFLIALISLGQAEAQVTYAEKLGFEKGKKVIILHVDDAGMSDDSNQGTIQALEQGLATSTSVMMPCGWVSAFMNYLKKNPKTDAGVHLVLTSEWAGYRWEPLAGKASVPSLYDQEGNFYHNVAQVVQNASATDVATEISTQIERFRAFGIEPTHIDSHMGTLLQPKFIQQYIKVGIQNEIPVMFPGGHASLALLASQATEPMKAMIINIGQQLWQSGLPVLDDLHADSYGWNLPADVPTTDQNLRALKTSKYIDILNRCKPGLTMIIMHCTLPSDNFKNISDSGPTRKGDLLAMTDPVLKAYIEKEGIILTTWREIGQRRKSAKTD
jgi:predicted glycoside hydrolase/deacetylase ChbG (UPF0249 family)